MGKIIIVDKFELWWRKAQAWFATQFSSINVDLVHVEEKVDEVKSDVADVRTAVDSTKQEIRNVAGSCIIPDFELPCLPFERGSGFSGLENNGAFYFGDFAPQAGGLTDQLFVGAIIKVIGDNATEGGFAGFPAGSHMSVAAAVSEEEAGYEQGLYSTLMEGDPVYGVTSKITWQKDRYYRVTGFHDIYDMTRQEVITDFVITYEEINPDTITDLGKQVYDKIDNQVAKESTSLEIKQLIINEGVEHANEYAETINEIIGDWSNE